MRISRPRIGSLAVAIALASASFGMSLGWQVSAVAAASAANTQGNEAVTLINGTRAAAGLGPVAADSLLTSLARNGLYRCGDTAYATISGRARDFATYNYTGHYVRNCLSSSLTLSTLTFVSVMQRDFGFGSVGEIVGYNTYGVGAYTYTYGTYSASTYETTGHIVTAWMLSSSHKAIILGGYDRVGCGVYYNGGYYYDCLFSVGGGHGWSPPLPPATARPKATVLATPTPTASPSPTPSPSPTVSPSPAAPSEAVAGIVAPSTSPTTDPAAAALLDSGPGGDISARDVAVRGGIIVGAMLALFAAAGLTRRLFRRGRSETIT